jgi:dsDNA-specific endonuclease/ATPase MutS2
MNNYKALEFDTILERLAEHALSEPAKSRCRALEPSLSEAEVRRWMDDTTQARRLIEQAGTPPLASMAELPKVLGLVDIEAMLLPEQLEHVLTFIVSCRRLKGYLRKAEATGYRIALYGGSIDELSALETEIRRCIVNGTVADKASSELDGLRRQLAAAAEQIKSKLDDLLRKNKDWFSESFVSVRNGRSTLPVKREHRNDVSGTVVEISNKGGTCFVEPSSVGKLQSKLDELRIEEDCEVRRILYALTALVGEHMREIRLNIEAMETLDFLFAKGKLSISMKASPVALSAGRRLSLLGARHPLLNQDSAVPLDFEVGGDVRGVVITGPNTGGKTVALKTVGLLSLMAQSGLHVTADGGSSLCLHNMIVCDIGDGQSITENLSTFSSHMKNVIAILRQISDESLVLLDELGSGTDPAEGMGIAVGVLDALCEKDCLFVATTHYPEIKEYAAKTPGLVNARMAFDKDSLAPLYRLELGKAGESCALYIAQRLGMPAGVLRRAHAAAYGCEAEGGSLTDAPDEKAARPPKIIRLKEQPPEMKDSIPFNIGDSVFVAPNKEIGIVCARANEMGEVIVQVKGEKRTVNHKRLKLHVPASELYPEDYDFSIIFDTVANRKARHLMGKRHEEGNVIIISEGEDAKKR